MECIHNFDSYKPIIEVEANHKPALGEDHPHIYIADIMSPLATAIKFEGSSVEKIFNTYDKDKSYLLSVGEISKVIEHFLLVDVGKQVKHEISVYI